MIFLLLLIINLSAVSLATETSCDEINEVKKFLERKVEEVQETCDKRYKELEQKLHAKTTKRSLGTGIAFSAQLTVAQSHLQIGTTIKFNKVLVNDGPGYDNRTGVFIAPEAGVYMFTYFIGNGGNRIGQTWMGLMHNGQKVNGAVTDVFHINEDLQGGNSALIRMDAGDRAWIQTVHQKDAFVDGLHGFSSFSGIYLYN